MSAAVCPKCGVAVVPGYVKCPKCQAPLAATRRRAQTNLGGTAVAGQGLPITALVVGGAVALAIVLFFALRKDKPAAAPPAETAEQAEPAQTVTTTTPDPTTAPNDPTPTPGSAAPDSSAAVSELDRALKKERLWGTVQVVGARVDVRSGACNDPGMAPVLAAAATPLRDAGLTRLRCMEQSGAVVFERDL